MGGDDELWALALREIGAQSGWCEFSVLPGNSQLKRAASVMVPDLGGVHTVPMAGFAFFQKKIDCGSGGALAIGVADRLLMLEYSTYSVISTSSRLIPAWRLIPYR